MHDKFDKTAQTRLEKLASNHTLASLIEAVSSDKQIMRFLLLPYVMEAEKELHREDQNPTATIFDTFKIDGKPLGDYTFAEASGVGRTKIRDGHILLDMARAAGKAKGPL